MNENNYADLVNQLEDRGFGSDISLQLLNQIYRGQPKFSTQYDVYYDSDRVSALLQFRKADKEGMYFFDNFKLRIFKGNNGEATNQTFYNGRADENITLKEAYNLLEGRAIYKEIANKEGMKCHIWVQLDFKQTDEHGNFKRKTSNEYRNFNLEKLLSKHPISEMNIAFNRTILIESLKKGNRQPVTYKVGDQERKVFIEAAPQFNSINFYDMNSQRLNPHQLVTDSAQAASEENIQVQYKQQKKFNAEEGSTIPKNRKRSRGTGIY